MEPFEVYPGARLSSCLVVALYILYSPADRFARWDSMEGAPQAAAQHLYGRARVPGRDSAWVRAEVLEQLTADLQGSGADVAGACVGRTCSQPLSQWRLSHGAQVQRTPCCLSMPAGWPAWVCIPRPHAACAVLLRPGWPWSRQGQPRRLPGASRAASCCAAPGAPALTALWPLQDAQSGRASAGARSHQHIAGSGASAAQ